MRELRLTEVLSDNMDKNIKIGFENGNGFFYCGPVNECDLESLNDQVREWVKNATCNAEINLTSTTAHIPDDLINSANKFRVHVKDNNGKSIPKLSSKRIYDYAKDINTIVEPLKRQIDRVIKMNKYEKSYVPITKRKVVSVYNSIISENEIIVIIEGIEIGPYWDDDEYGNN